MRTQLALLASAAVVLLSGCASTGVGADPAAPSALAGDWALVSGTDGDGDFDLAGSTITLTLDDDVVTGRAPCNSYRGTAETDGASVSFSELMMTKAACQLQDLNVLEQRYVAALGAATSVRVDGAALELGDGAGLALRFEPVPDGVGDDSAALAGTAWTLGTVLDGDIATAAVGAGALSFSADGTTLAGNAGCHDFTADFATAGGVVLLAGLDVAHNACTDETAAQEDAVFGVLSDGLVVTRDGDTLTARNAVNGVPVSLVYSFQAS